MKRRVRFPKPCFCYLCGGEVTKDFAFDVNPGVWAHPSCFAYTHSEGGTNGRVASRTIEKGQRVIQTCDNPLCCNPEHLEAVYPEMQVK